MHDHLLGIGGFEKLQIKNVHAHALAGVLLTPLDYLSADQADHSCPIYFPQPQSSSLEKEKAPHKLDLVSNTSIPTGLISYLTPVFLNI